MAEGAIQSLSKHEAVQRFEALAIPTRPATLHPHYVAADAARNQSLQPAYLCYEQGGECWMHALHLTEVAGTQLRDASSPYGYGGPVCTTDDIDFVNAAWSAYLTWMREQRVAVEYIRFHPVLGNERHYGGRHADNREVVSVDLQPDDFTLNYAVRLRQTVKKAIGSGLVYEEIDLRDHGRQFGEYHRSAMREMQTDSFYLFDDSYFEQLGESGFAKLSYCRGPEEGSAWLAAAVFLDGAGVREYHLAATNDAGRKLGASSFLLHEAALSAKRAARSQLYLGGGTDTKPENPLLFFKSGFSGRRLMYRTGSTIFDERAYDELKDRFPAEWAAHPERPIFYRKV
jgi:hypothetical protein